MLAEYWATKASLEVAQSAFLETGAIGIEIDDGIGPEAQKKYPDDRILVRAYFEPKGGLEGEVKKSLQLFFDECDLSLGPVDFSSVEEEDWQGNFVRSCTTFVVEPNIYIVPSFEIDEFKKNPGGELFIEMDPENAFGTGQHQTTKLCLKSIHDLLSAKSKDQLSCLSAIDVGTGSGILAILMKKLGVRSVLATETDEDALITAQRNARKNGVAIEPLKVNETHEYDREKYDLVVANILAAVLIAMKENLTACCKPGGRLVLSGILVGQADGVISAYESSSVHLIKRDVMDDWCALIFAKS